MSVLRRALASLGVLAASVGSLVLPSMTAPASASTVVAGYVNVPVTINATGWTTLPSGAGFGTAGGAISVYRFGTGKYEVLFPGLAPGYSLGESVPGVAIAHAGDWGNCQRSTLAVGDGAGDLTFNVNCYDFGGALTDRPFTASYTRGGTDAGTLGTVRMQLESTAPIGTVTTPATQFSSLSGTITSTRTATGNYEIRIPRQAGDRPHALDVGAVGSAQSVNCAVLSTATESAGTVEKIRVICRGVPGVGVLNTPFDLSFAEETNPLGLGRLSHAYLTAPSFVTVPASTPPVTLTADVVRNVIYGVPGSVTLQHTGTGKFEVQLQNQDWQVGAATVSVIPVGSADTRCAVTADFTVLGSGRRTVRFQCSNAYGDALADPAFQLNYSALQ
ncbi:hypothetical protein [Sphaerisporangium corydalis]|uniref:Uncharacterized protein n=1 Tax=Sphaerisporangium corydalis TaxID=1441875 RepID=A0ABV9EFG1_9ACTN|nr:hypothetical protein [Sphaerisporangium corydalis]